MVLKWSMVLVVAALALATTRAGVQPISEGRAASLRGGDIACRDAVLASPNCSECDNFDGKSEKCSGSGAEYTCTATILQC